MHCRCIASGVLRDATAILVVPWLVNAARSGLIVCCHLMPFMPTEDLSLAVLKTIVNSALGPPFPRGVPGEGPDCHLP
jgi:hypothetical protein